MSSPAELSAQPPPEPSDAAPRDTVGRLLSAAAAAFADKGYHATTTRDIASGADLSPAGVYVHFSSKEDVLYQLSRRGHRQALALVRSAVDVRDTPARQLASVVARFSAWHAEHYAIARVVQHEFPHLSDEHRDEVLDLRKQIDATVREIIERGQSAGEFLLDHVPDTVLALMSIVVDVARWYNPSQARSPAEVGETNAVLCLRLVGYAGPAP
ncbi:MAG: TetR family transcriptional regulator [Actinomycetales bacterium]|nr:MAG: TetR family transcriptional regulator [Actinomycetales bacterium]